MIISMEHQVDKYLSERYRRIFCTENSTCFHGDVHGDLLLDRVDDWKLALVDLALVDLALVANPARYI